MRHDIQRWIVAGLASLAAIVPCAAQAAIVVGDFSLCQYPGTATVLAKLTDAAGIPKPYAAVRFEVLPLGSLEAIFRYAQTYTGPDGTAATILGLGSGGVDSQVDIRATEVATGQSDTAVVTVWLGTICETSNFSFPPVIATQGNPYIALGTNTGFMGWVGDSFIVYSTDPRVAVGVNGTVNNGTGGNLPYEPLAMDVQPIQTGSAFLIVPHTQSIAVTVNPVDPSAPVISSAPLTAAYLGVSYSYPISATSPTGKPLSFSLETAPAGMAIDVNTGLIGWEPVFDNIDQQIVRARVSDGTLSTYHHFRILLCGGKGDRDRDGVCDPDDNCPYNVNPAQSDADADGLGDACDLGIRYALKALGDLPGGAYSFALALNSLGQAVGSGNSNNGPSEAFFWDAALGMIGLGDLAGGIFQSRSTGINDNGQVVGEGLSVSGFGAFLWNSQNGIVGLGDLPGGQSYSRAEAINNAGQVVGVSDSSSGDQAFLWDPVTRTMKGLGDLAGGSFSSHAYGINSVGDVVGFSSSDLGYEAFLLAANQGPMRGLGELPGGETYSVARAINDNQQVVGISTSSSGREAFIWDATAGMLGLGDLPGGGYSSAAYDVNIWGQVVGQGTSDRGQEAFLWDTVHRAMVPLQQLTDATADGWRITYAGGINDKSQIAGYGINPQGRSEAFLLTPISGGPMNSCVNQYPQMQITLDGGGQSNLVNATLTETFTGHIISYTNTSLTICRGTVLNYEATSTVGNAMCTVSASPTASTGSVTLGDKLICTNKPAGQDTDRFRILAK